jgi:hypothetical protein
MGVGQGVISEASSSLAGRNENSGFGAIAKYGFNRKGLYVAARPAFDTNKDSVNRIAARDGRGSPR